jgi:hypothetical protein
MSFLDIFILFYYFFFTFYILDAGCFFPSPKVTGIYSESTAGQRVCIVGTQTSL